MNKNNSKELVSRCVKAGSRVYFFDAKQDSYGHNYLVISENRSNLKTGERERHRLFIYEEDFEKFAGAFEEVLAELRNPKTEDSSISLDPVELPKLDDFLED